MDSLCFKTGIMQGKKVPCVCSHSTMAFLKCPTHGIECNCIDNVGDDWEKASNLLYCPIHRKRESVHG